MLAEGHGPPRPEDVRDVIGGSARILAEGLDHVPAPAQSLFMNAASSQAPMSVIGERGQSLTRIDRS